jgi:hypothetical protein
MNQFKWFSADVAELPVEAPYQASNGSPSRSGRHRAGFWAVAAVFAVFAAAQLADPTTATLWFSGFLAVRLTAIALLGRTVRGDRRPSP